MSRKILVVDDSDNIRTVLKVNFEWIGYDVLSARDGEEAIHLVQEEKPDLIILDVMMPRRNGYQVCRRFKSDPQTASIPVILLTAKSQEEDMFWGRDCGADEFITKPFQTSELEAAVRSLLSRSMKGPRGSRSGTQLLREQLDRRVRKGLVCGVCGFSLDPRALEVYRQKYGELRATELYDEVARVINAVMKEAGVRAVTEREGQTFRVFVPRAAKKIESLQNRILDSCKHRLLGRYDETDRSRGHVMSRDYRSGKDICVPLLTLHATSPELYNQGKGCLTSSD